MRIVNMHEAKTHLSRLVEAAANGEPFIIARAGKPVVKVVALEAPGAGSTRRIGFMAGNISICEDFDRMGAEDRIHVRRQRLKLLPTRMSCFGQRAHRVGCRTMRSH